MALQKRIDELDAATQVNSTDMFAVAQTGSNEAVRATTSQLAAAVQELNEGGALSEMTYAMSIGKNYLAQVLNNKGVSAQPTETLIALVDKVDKLNIDSNFTNIIAGTAISASSATNANNKYCNLQRDPATGNLILWYGTVIYYIPAAETYDSFSSMMNAASFYIDCGTDCGSTYYIMSVSTNGKFLAVKTSTTDVKVYEIKSSEFEYKATVTFSTSMSFSESYCNLAINPTGTVVMQDKYMKHIATGVETSVADFYSRYNGDTILTTDKIYHSAGYGTSASNTGYYQCYSYSVDDTTGVATCTQIYYDQGTPSTSVHNSRYIVVDTDRILWIGIKLVSKWTDFGNGTQLYITEADKNLNSSPYITLITRATGSTGYQSSSSNYSVLACLSPDITYDSSSNTYSITAPTIGETVLTYNATSNTISSSTEVTLDVHPTNLIINDPVSYTYVHRGIRVGNKLYTKGVLGSESASNHTFYQVTFSPNMQRFGILYKGAGGLMPFLTLDYSVATINSGVYEVKNPTVLEPDEE